MVVIGLIAGAGLYVTYARNNAVTIYNSIDSSPPQLKNKPPFEHIVIIVEENRGYKAVMESADAPYIKQLATTYGQASQYFALFHPSLPNYLAMTGGTNGGIEQNCAPAPSCELTSKSIVDEIEATGRSWKGYMESMPTACSMQDSGLYAVRHNPFVYYKNLANDQQRCQQHDVSLDQLYKDLESNKLPNFSFITPNLCNDMHDCSVATGDKWLASVVPKLLQSSAFKDKKSLLIITWDEAERTDAENRIPTILAGPVVKKGYNSSTNYTHYSLLKTIEEAWGVSPLTESDKKAASLSEFFSTTN